MRSTARPALFLSLWACGAAALLVAIGLPSPLPTWLLLTAAYGVLRRSFPSRIGPAWLALVAMATALDPGTAVSGVVLACGLGVALLSKASADWRRSILVDAAPALTVAFLAMLVAGRAISPVFFAAAGAAAGCGVFVATFLQPTSGGPHAEDVELDGGRLVRLATIGAVAGLLGFVAAEVGVLMAPVVVAAVMVLASPEYASREAAAAERDVLRSLLQVLEIKDLYTRGHAERVAAYAGLIGAEMGLTGHRLLHLTRAGLLHDIGKVGVARHLLRKRDRLDDEEYCAVQVHATSAADLLEGISFLAPVVPFVVEHHRHLDGGGYGAEATEGLSLESRIVSVADAFDAMTTHRPYRKALTRSFAIAELQRHSDTQFDAEVVAAFVRCVEQHDLAPAATGVDSDAVARLAALGITEVPEVIHAAL